MSNVKNYTDAQILARVESLKSFRGFPDRHWLIGVRSNEDAFNFSDDKIYQFVGCKFVSVSIGTTNAGIDLLNPRNPRGTAVLKADEIYYDSHIRRLHNGKVLAWCQAKTMLIHRDFNRNKRTEELGTAKPEIIGLNIHPMSYIFGSKIERQIIGRWSEGCQCYAIRDDFDEMMESTANQNTLTYCLLNEF